MALFFCGVGCCRESYKYAHTHTIFPQYDAQGDDRFPIALGLIRGHRLMTRGDTFLPGMSRSTSQVDQRSLSFLSLEIYREKEVSVFSSVGSSYDYFFQVP